MVVANGKASERTQGLDGRAGRQQSLAQAVAGNFIGGYAVSSSSANPQSQLGGILGFVERIGNKLPHPATLFAIFAALVVILSKICARAAIGVTHPVTHQPIVSVDLLSIAGLHRMLVQAVPNFIEFPPLGVVIVILLGLAVAEHTGLIGVVLRLIVLSSPPRLLTPIVVFVGVMSHVGGDIGFVLIVPLGAAIFHAAGRHPLAGLAAAFAGVGGGFSACLLLTPLDVLAAGISTAAAQLLDPAATVSALANWYFMMTSALVIIAVGTWISERIVEPRLGPYRGDAPAEPLIPLNAGEKRGLVWSAVALAGFAAIVVVGIVPLDGFLRNPKNPDFFQSYFIKGLPALIFLTSLTAGLAYGVASRTVRNDGDVMKCMTKSMETMGTYIVIAFFAGQFLAYFSWTNLGVITAVNGAELIKSSGVGPVPLMISVVLFTSLINLVIASALAKWTMLAPVLVPMFMLLGYSPAFTQAAFRIGASCTNIITPLLGYFPLILLFARRYVPSAGIGTIIAAMLPFSISFLISWMSLLAAWMLLNLPLGPGAPIFLGH